MYVIANEGAEKKMLKVLAFLDISEISVSS